MAASRSSTPKRVGDLLTAAVPGLGERLLTERIREQWSETVGRDLARHCQPGELRLGVLQLVADNSPCLHELTLRAAEILATLTARYPGTVRTLRFSPGSVAPRETRPRLARRKRGAK